MPNESMIIAAFRSSTDAQAAAADLEAAGVARDDIYLEAVGLETGGESSSKSKSHEGGIAGWFKSLFGEEQDDDRSRYENALSQGNCLLKVEVDQDEVSSVETILNRHSPIDVHADAGTATGSAAKASRTTNDTDAISVVQEEMQVGKREVLRGGVRVYSRVVEEPVEESIGLREERVRVERRPVNRAATSADLSAGEDQVIEVQEFAEEPVVAKQARVVEEVRVGKDVSERTETIRDTVRHTEVDVEQTEGTGETSGDSELRGNLQKKRSVAVGQE